MTMFIKIENGQPVGNPLIDQNMWYLFPNFNWNRAITSDLVAELGYAVYEFTQVPEPGNHQKVIETTPLLNTNNGTYYQQWQVVDMTEEEKAAADARQSDIVRENRYIKLALTDWAVLPDVQISEARKQQFLSYRQQLRDITDQPGFPWEIVWPEQP